MLYDVIKYFFPNIYWRIYREGANHSADSWKSKPHKFTIVPSKGRKFQLPLYKKPFSAPNNSQPMMVH